MEIKKILITIVACFALSSSVVSQTWQIDQQNKKGKLTVHYYENEPYIYKNKKGNLTGIEHDILIAFVDWLKANKGVELTLAFKGYQEYGYFISELKNADQNSIGLGSVAWTNQRAAEMDFASPYLKNVSVLLTSGLIPTARTKEELEEIVKRMFPVTIKGSVHQKHLQNLYGQDIQVEYDYVFKPEDIANKIIEDSKYYGYIDVITFWKYMKTSDEYLKMQSMANRDDEKFSFVLPSQSSYTPVVNEFFERGFGFTSTKTYHQILEKHLGPEILEQVELDYIIR